MPARVPGWLHPIQPVYMSPHNIKHLYFLHTCPPPISFRLASIHAPPPPCALCSCPLLMLTVGCIPFASCLCTLPTCLYASFVQIPGRLYPIQLVYVPPEAEGGKDGDGRGRRDGARGRPGGSRWVRACERWVQFVEKRAGLVSKGWRQGPGWGAGTGIVVGLEGAAGGWVRNVEVMWVSWYHIRTVW